MSDAGVPAAGLARIAVLGGDAREVVMAHLLSRDGHDVATYGLGEPACRSLSAADGLGSAVALEAASAPEAVVGRSWLLCPNPGLGEDDRVYAPFASASICLNEDLLRASDVVTGGIVLGRASASLMALASTIGTRVHESKNDEALKVRLAASAAEGLLAMLVERTDQVLRDQRVLVLGYGATGSAIADRLVLLGSQVTVAARREESLAHAEEHGARAVPFENRVAAMAEATVIVNTVPSVSSMPADVLGGLDGCLVMDIASPPGGTDHAAARAAGLGLLWLRGLVGERAPRTAGELQYRFVKNVIDSRSRALAAPPPA